MKNLKFFLGSAAALCLMAGCADEWVVNDTNKPNEGAPFVIHANNGADADTRLAFGENGLSLQWEDGDQLVLVSVDDKVAPIYLTTTLDEPATKATFVANGEAPAGTYYVFNVPDFYDDDKKPEKFKDWICPDIRYRYSWEEPGLYDNLIDDKYKLQNLLELGKYTRMYSGPIEIVDGQTSLDINLEHGFSLIKFNITGGDWATIADASKTIGMICPSKSFPVIARLDGTEEASKTSAKLEIGSEDYNTSKFDISTMGAFILPVDLSNQDVYFYISFSDNNNDETEERVETAYEIVKKGINLKAGTSYTINLDLNAPTTKKIELRNGQISTPDHFRLLAYKIAYRKYMIVQDIDFAGKTYFPITAPIITPATGIPARIDGDGHILSNLAINWFDGAGLFEYIRGTEISDLHLQNVTVNGTNYVGAFCGKLGMESALHNCTLIGTNQIIGTGNYVGGLVGSQVKDYYNWGDAILRTCNINKETTIQGRDFVGGIAGQIEDVIDCTSAAKVIGMNKVGGIAGYVHCSINSKIAGCTSSATINASRDYAGGLIGYTDWYNPEGSVCNVEKCSFTGIVNGQNYVGGIIGFGGANLFNECYSTSSVSGNSYVGGIAGSDCRVHNSYFIGTVTGKDAATTAGITGYMNRDRDWYESIQSNCYSAGTISSGYGIMATDKRNTDGTYINIVNCLTTAPHLGSADTEAEQAYTNITSIQEHLDVINGELAYSTTNIWLDYSFDCPKLRWQTTISTGTGDEGTDAPEFEEDEW